MAKTNFKTIDEYHVTFSEEVQKQMRLIRDLIHKVVPNVEESISYQIPCFKYKGYLIYYSAYSKHITISYPFSQEFLNEFKTDLLEYKISKSALQLPLNKPMPITMLKKMIAFRKKENDIKSKLLAK